MVSWSDKDVELYVALVEDWPVQVTPPVTYKYWYQLPEPAALNITLSPSQKVLLVRLSIKFTDVVGDTFIE